MRSEFDYYDEESSSDQSGWSDNLRYNKNRLSPCYGELESPSGRVHHPKARNMSAQTKKADMKSQSPEETAEPKYQLIAVERRDLCQECREKAFQENLTGQHPSKRKTICSECKYKISQKKDLIIARYV